jgi:hypothetical protein
MKDTDEKKELKYEVIVELNDPTCLADSDKLKTLLSEASLKGNVSTNICFAQSDDNSLGMVKKFRLEYETDFQTFATVITNVDGVKNVKKGDGPWKRSWKESLKNQLQKKQIQKEKEKRSEESWKRMEKDLDEFNGLIEELERKLNEEFGDEEHPIQPISWSEFDKRTPAGKKYEAEFYFTLSDPLLGGFLEYKKESGTFNSMDEALEFFTTHINANLIAFYSPIKHVRNIPVGASFRRKSDKTAIFLTACCGKPTFQLGFYRLYVEIT